MLGNAKQILISELVLTNGIDKDQVEDMISDKIQKAFDVKMSKLEI